jgi:hypothetical protein
LACLFEFSFELGDIGVASANLLWAALNSVAEVRKLLMNPMQLT